MTQRENDGSGWTVFLFGAIVGAGVALLFAPMSGKQTRRTLAEIDPDSIKGSMNSVIDGVSDIVDRGVDAYKKASAQTRA